MTHKRNNHNNWTRLCRYIKTGKWARYRSRTGRNPARVKCSSKVKATTLD